MHCLHTTGWVDAGKLLPYWKDKKGRNPLHWAVDGNQQQMMLRILTQRSCTWEQTWEFFIVPIPETSFKISIRMDLRMCQCSG